MKKTIATGIAALALILTACTTTAVSGNFCSTDGDCVDGQLCVNGECFDSRNETDQTPCTSDGDCSSGTVCAATGFCEALGSGTSCTVTADCPVTQYCNISIQSPICTPLQPGACREASQCAGLMCTATAGGVGRCVECLRGADCSSGTCNPDGTCGTGSGGVDAGVTDSGGLDSSGFDSTLPDSGGCYPACNSAAGESCVAGVCYGANGCPLNAHPDGAGCVCDTGFAPNASGTACVASSGGSDAGTTLDSGGGTGDCTPACYSAETCYMGTCYNAEGCPRNSHADGQYCTCDDGYVPNAAGTGCEIAGAGSCPPNAHPENGGCACDAGYQPNAAGTACEPIGGGYDAGVPDSGGGDFCEQYGLYNNGTCDDYCPSPDPDCGSGGGTGSCPANAHPESDGYCYCDAGYTPDPGGTYCVPESGGGGSDPCADYGYYGDGECDTFCANPDPDCGGGSGDFCYDYGWYGDGICDTQCPQPDPDCGGGSSGDYCADWGWYNDGYCDDCPSPDPDCSGGGGGGGYNYCESDWDCWSGYYCDWWSSTCEPY